MKKIRALLWVVILLVTGCGKQARATTAPVATAIPATATLAPTATPIPVPTRDPTVFGAIGTGEIQAFALESVANAIFQKTMNELVASGSIQEFQVTSVTIFPGNGGLLSEIIFNVKTNDANWLSNGGTPAADGWINGSCNRFDFFTTETEYQLKNWRLCS